MRSRRIAVILLLIASAAPPILTSSSFSNALANTPTLASQSSYACPYAYSSVIGATSGLVNYWRLGESSGTTATDAMAANNGTYVNAPTLGVAGASSSMGGDTAVGFNGSTQNVNMGSIDNFSGTSTFSAEVWVKRTAAGSGFESIVSTTSGSPAEGWGVVMRPNDYNIKMERYQAGASDQAASVTRMALGTWHHVVVTYDGTTMVVYIDGNREATTASSKSISATARTLRIGSSGSGGSNFHGAVDEVAIYNRALTPAEVQDHTANCSYASTIARTSGLVDYWRMDETSGTTAYDSGPGAATGTFTSASMLKANGALTSSSRPAVRFTASSSQVLAATTNDNFAGTSPFTVEMWVKPASLSASIYSRLISYEQTDGNGRQGWTVLIDPAASQAVFQRWSNGTSNSVQAGTSFVVGTWTYVVATYDGSTMRLYLNGSSVASQSSSQSIATFATSLRVGNSYSNSAFDGILDEVAVYNVALSGATIAAHYAAR